MWTENSKYKSCGFQTSRDLTIRRLIGYWNGTQSILFPSLAVTVFAKFITFDTATDEIFTNMATFLFQPENATLPCLSHKMTPFKICLIPYGSPQNSDILWWRHQMETFSALLTFLRGIHRSAVNSPHKGQWRGALMFSLICAWINGWLSSPLWRHCNVFTAIIVQWRVHDTDSD